MTSSGTMGLEPAFAVSGTAIQIQSTNLSRLLQRQHQWGPTKDGATANYNRTILCTHCVMVPQHGRRRRGPSISNGKANFKVVSMGMMGNRSQNNAQAHVHNIMQGGIVSQTTSTTATNSATYSHGHQVLREDTTTPSGHHHAHTRNTVPVPVPVPVSVPVPESRYTDIDVDVSTDSSSDSEGIGFLSSSFHKKPGDLETIHARTPDSTLIVRNAQRSELTIVADIRAAAFYGVDSDVKAEKQEQILTGSIARIKRPGAYTFVVSERDKKRLTETVIATVDASIFDGFGRRFPSIVPMLSVTRQRLKPGSLQHKAHESASSLHIDVDDQDMMRNRLIYVSSMAVKQGYRRMGAAKLLLEHTRRFAARERISHVFLHVDEVNTAAVRLYSLAGFQVVNHGEVPSWINTLAEEHHTLLCWSEHGEPFPGHCV